MEKNKTRRARTASSPSRPKAATNDVLGPKQPSVKINPKWAANHRHLTELRDSLLRLKDSLAHDANDVQPNFSEHMADAGTDSYDRDFALSLLTSDQNALNEIDEAIRRIETGSYGVCERTGKPIPVPRLSAVPWTRFTVEAEIQLEQTGVAHRARLGELGSLKSSAETNQPEPDTD